MMCRDAITLEQLVEYWTSRPGDVAGGLEPAHSLDEHLFGCDACARRLGWIAALATALPAALHRRGGVSLALTSDLVARLEREGVAIRHYRPASPNAEVACTVAFEDDLVISWLHADPSEDERVEVSQVYPDGTVIRVDDAPVDPATGCVIYAVAAEKLRPLPKIDLQIRVVAVSPAGRRTLGEYTYHHTPMAS